jgi:hypothetical protein
MKRRILSLAVALVLTLALAAPAAFAAEGKTVEYTADPSSWYRSRASFSITNVISQNDDKNQKVFTCNAPVIITLLPDERGYYSLGSLNWEWSDNVTKDPTYTPKYYYEDETGEMIFSTKKKYDTRPEDENVFSVIADGMSLTLHEPGEYSFSYTELETEENNGTFSLILVGDGGEAPATPPAPTTPTPTTPTVPTVSPTASTVSVNGAAQSFEAYNIGGNNFFKLRDLAMVLNGTEKQFEVGFDAASKAITLTSGAPYTAAGGEMTPGDGKAKTANPTQSTVTLDGKELALTAYNIGGNNFFTLRDLMQALDVYVGYDAATKAVTIDSTAGYVAE